MELKAKIYGFDIFEVLGKYNKQKPIVLPIATPEIKPIKASNPVINV
jgi:hypothetical protein